MTVLKVVLVNHPLSKIFRFILKDMFLFAKSNLNFTFNPPVSTDYILNWLQFPALGVAKIKKYAEEPLI